MKLPAAAPNMRIGLLGGSFNPAHAAHREISLTALRRLGLDQVWWLVAPNNPLKDAPELPGRKKRVKDAAALARHPRIKVTGATGTSSYTVDLLRDLKRRFPGVHFVWLMGADNLANFHRWCDWETIFGLMPIAVLDRPGFRLKARAGQPAQRFADFYVDESDATGLAVLIPPAWTLLSHPLSSLSSTKLRTKPRKAKAKPKAKDKQKKKKPKRG